MIDSFCGAQVILQAVIQIKQISFILKEKLGKLSLWRA